MLEFDEDYIYEVDIQDLLRNLGFFDIALKVYDLIESVEEDEDGNVGEVGENTITIVKMCSELMYWFLLDNPKNQVCLYIYNFFDFFYFIFS